MDDVEQALGEMCNVVKNTYGNEEGGFIAGQVFAFDGFVSDEGPVGAASSHEKSHADSIFKEKFLKMAELCTDTYELGFSMLWQGDPSH